MRRLSPGRHAWFSVPALLFALGCGGSYRPAAPGPEGTPDIAPGVVTGTCRAYDLDARTLDVVTGVSTALRSMTFRVHDGTRITIGERRASLAEMRANVVVRVEYRATPEGNLADRITVILDARGIR